ncbi:hypothetical protein HYPDE_33523 [Hyphomicrobium denitrificans 1NES1]|uniref:Uncharacterized protein n=1 Tax=Hyphomicrobium denitrificans 1NES1 TaxID=670307 RepID=N0B802_9HYPH|nr:hypothetical protein HYPDE_33523 [Hyphomicrobium denitrificans 1NES1]
MSALRRPCRAAGFPHNELPPKRTDAVAFRPQRGRSFESAFIAWPSCEDATTTGRCPREPGLSGNALAKNRATKKGPRGPLLRAVEHAAV